MSGRAQTWVEHLSAITAEGISIQAYASREGLSAASLYYWRKRLKPALGTADNEVSQLVEVRVEQAAPELMRCKLLFAPGVRLELEQLPSAAWLAQLVTALTRPQVL